MTDALRGSFVVGGEGEEYGDYLVEHCGSYHVAYIFGAPYADKRIRIGPDDMLLDQFRNTGGKLIRPFSATEIKHKPDEEQQIIPKQAMLVYVSTDNAAVLLERTGEVILNEASEFILYDEAPPILPDPPNTHGFWEWIGDAILDKDGEVVQWRGTWTFRDGDLTAVMEKYE